jgi:hypothetical protein
VYVDGTADLSPGNDEDSFSRFSFKGTEQEKPLLTIHTTMRCSDKSLRSANADAPIDAPVVLKQMQPAVRALAVRRNAAYFFAAAARRLSAAAFAGVAS